MADETLPRVLAEAVARWRRDADEIGAAARDQPATDVRRYMEGMAADYRAAVAWVEGHAGAEAERATHDEGEGSDA